MRRVFRMIVGIPIDRVGIPRSEIAHGAPRAGRRARLFETRASPRRALYVYALRENAGAFVRRPRGPRVSSSGGLG